MKIFRKVIFSVFATCMIMGSSLMAMETIEQKKEKLKNLQEEISFYIVTRKREDINYNRNTDPTYNRMNNEISELEAKIAAQEVVAKPVAVKSAGIPQPAAIEQATTPQPVQETQRKQKCPPVVPKLDNSQVRLCIKNLTEEPIFVAIIEIGHILGVVPQFKSNPETHQISSGEIKSIPIAKTTQANSRFLYWDIKPIEKLTIGYSYAGYIDLGKEISSNRSVKVITKSQIAQKAAAIIKNQPHANDQAKVEFDNMNLGDKSITMVKDEAEALSARDKKTHQTITAIAGGKPSKLPRVGLCFSGGGLRAMFESLGFAIGLEETGLLDTVSYAASLSGSTWLLMKWLKESGDKTLNQIRVDLEKSLIKGLLEPEILKPNGKDMNEVDPYRAALQLAGGTMYSPAPDFEAQLKATLLCHNEQCTRSGKYRVIELWAYGIARRIFAKHIHDKYTFTLSSLSNKAKAGLMPIPLFSSVRTDDDENYAFVMSHRTSQEETRKPRDYQWLEATPFSASFLHEGGNGNTQVSRIPMWALGRKFENSASVKQSKDFFQRGLDLEGLYYHPEPSAVQLLGAFGAAFSVTFFEVGKAEEKVEKVLNRVAIHGAIKLWLDKTNLAKGLYINDISANATREPIELRDGGIYYNLPLPLLFNPRRNLDIIIVNDTSGNLHEKLGNELNKFRSYEPKRDYITYKLSKDFLDEKQYQYKIAMLRNTPFDGKPAIAVFNDPREANYEPDRKTIIYVPSISTAKSKSYGWKSPTDEYSTFKLQYSGKESSMLVDYSIDLAKQVAQDIKAVIKARTEKMNREQ